MIDVDWLDDAACRGTELALWFTPARADEAAEVCSRCPVAARCHAYAERHRISDGVWGGVARDRPWTRQRPAVVVPDDGRRRCPGCGVDLVHRRADATWCGRTCRDRARRTA